MFHFHDAREYFNCQFQKGPEGAHSHQFSTGWIYQSETGTPGAQTSKERCFWPESLISTNRMMSVLDHFESNRMIQRNIHLYTLTTFNQF